MIFLSRSKFIIGVLTLFTVIFYQPLTEAAVGESAVITLIFPPGARATGLGEAFTGLADDANATFFNPAGLGQAPQSNSWKAHLNNSGYHFTAIAAKKKKDFGQKDLIWAGTNKGLLRYNGKSWESYEIYLIQQNDNIEDIVSKFLKIEDPKIIKNAIWSIYTYNKIGQKQFAATKAQLLTAFQNKNIKNADIVADSIAKEIILIPSSDRDAAKIYALLSGTVDSLKADTLSDQLESVFLTKDVQFKDLDELKIPFEIAIKDSITCLSIDNSNRLWAGTSNGLWRYSDNEWNHFTIHDGLPSNNITSIAIGSVDELAVGTDDGIATYKDGKWSKMDTTDGLPSASVNALAYASRGVLYIGTSVGLVKTTDSTITVYDTSNGLLSNKVTALFYDSKERLWIGGENGLTISTPTSWKRYKFPDSKVISFTEHGNGNIWIGTNNGAISYKAGKTKVDKAGVEKEMPPTWKTFHSKNVLTDNDVRCVVDHDKDVWIATDKAINQYDNANKQLSMFYEQLLPNMGISDLWHSYISLVYPTQDWGTIGAFINYINMGNNELTNGLGQKVKNIRSWEGVFGVSYGIPLKENLSLGLNLKYVHSALAPGYGDNGEGVGQTFAIDASVLKRNFFLKKLDFGFMLQNMGPDIFYINKDNPDPLPFTLRMGLAYRAIQTPVHDLKLLLDLDREFVKNKFNGKPDPFYKALFTDLEKDSTESYTFKAEEINASLGLEYWYANFVALRTGFLLDYIGERFEWTLGLGLKYGALNFDFSYIYSPEGFMSWAFKHGSNGVRNGQWRISGLVQF